MHDLIRLVAAVGLVAPIACAKPRSLEPPAFRYPDLMRQAGIQGPVRFRVQLDSMGRPQLTTFKILATPNPAFTPAVRNGLQQWRDPSMAGRILEQTVLFVLMDTAATDSIGRCPSTGGAWAACGRGPRTTTLHTVSWSRAPNMRLKLPARVD